MQKFSVPRGTSDILPDVIPLWEDVESKARKILKSYGYREIRTPIYEETALFKRSLGQASDIVNKQLLELATSKEEGYALRPEGTASVVRSYIENSFDKKEPLSKLFYIGPMFRGERPQKGRLRQFHQIGVEAIGPNSASPHLDAEILALAMHLLKALGVKNPKLKINSLGSKEDKEHISVWLRGELKKHKKDLCEECQNRFERNVFRVLDCKNEACRKVAASVVKKLPLSDAGQDHFQSVQNALKSVGVDFEIAPHLVRGLDYYTHTVFEITADGLGSQDAVGAGGRYGGLVHELGGDAKTDFSAIGFALGIDRILLASGATQPVPSTIDAFVITMDETGQKQAFKLVNDLRHAGISADMSYSGGKIGSQMNRANKLNARFALILGEEEMKNGAIAVKNMTSGAQENVKLEGVLEYLRKRLL
ncbi:MAG: histidine--tRNA ligase [Candidatus Omnitrophota bacterium]|nr:histidine--tRNA ligase [Candidatus Omnitrophota bacterium]